jgi:AAA domain, putative AbiEii toxin, Type IV TA system
VGEVLALVGLTEAAHERIGGYSLGMSQRAGVAAVLLTDPRVLLDEPVNGLDPEGIRWIGRLMKRLAAEGRTVFVSSHLMSEMSVTADHLIVIGAGRLIADCSTQEFGERSSDRSVLEGPYLAVLGLFSMAIGALMRHTAGAVAMATGVAFVLPIIASFLPGGWGQHVHDYLPSVAGAMIAQAHQGADQVLSPWQGFGILCAWTALLLAAAFYLLRRRDA